MAELYCEMRMNRARDAEREVGFGRSARRALDLREMQHGAEVTRLELERARDVAQAVGVATEHVIEHGTLVPGLGEIGRAAQEACEACLRDVVATRGDVAGSEIELLRCGRVRMVHPHIPDALLGGLGLGPCAACEAYEESVEEWRDARGAPSAGAAKEPEDLSQCRHLSGNRVTRQRAARAARCSPRGAVRQDAQLRHRAPPRRRRP